MKEKGSFSDNYKKIKKAGGLKGVLKVAAPKGKIPTVHTDIVCTGRTRSVGDGDGRDMRGLPCQAKRLKGWISYQS